MAATTKLRTLVVSTSFPLSRNAVSGAFVKRLTDALARKADICVVAPAGRCLEDTGCHPYPVLTFRYGLRSWQALTHEPGGIPDALRRRRGLWLVVPCFLVSMLVAAFRRSRDADLIHANWSLPGLVCALVGRLRGLPAVTTLRGSDVARLDSSLASRAVLHGVMRWSDIVVTVSEPMRAALQRRYPAYAAKVEHIPNGVADALLRLPAVHLGGPLKLVAIGNLIRGKGLQDALAAIAQCRERVSLSIVGDGPERPTLEGMAADLGLSDRVRFLGTCPPDGIPHVLASHHALVLTSYSEGRPNVVVEAMAAGRAVLASSLPGVLELVEEGRTALLFQPGDVHALARAITRLERDPRLCQSLGTAARDAILAQGLTWDTCADRYMALYHRALTRARS